MNKKIIGLFLLLVCCNNSEQNGNDLTSTSITTTTSTLVTEIPDSNSEIKENIIYKTSGINLLFKNKFILNENFNSISDLDSVTINNEKFYLITMTYAKKIIMVDKDFNYM